jgi:hypothetical protein
MLDVLAHCCQCWLRVQMFDEITLRYTVTARSDFWRDSFRPMLMLTASSGVWRYCSQIYTEMALVRCLTLLLSTETSWRRVLMFDEVVLFRNTIIRVLLNSHLRRALRLTKQSSLHFFPFYGLTLKMKMREQKTGGWIFQIIFKCLQKNQPTGGHASSKLYLISYLFHDL